MNEFELSDLRFPSAVWTMGVLLLVLFCLEILIMYALPVLLPAADPYLENLADATMLTVLFSPVLYRYIFKPFRTIAAIQKSLSENILSNLVDGVILFDKQLAIHSFNSGAEKIFGYRGEEMMGQPVDLILGGSFLDSLSRAGNGGEAGCEPIDGIRECGGTRRDGTEVPVEFSLSQVRVGGRWLWLGIIRDISARRENDDKMKQTLSLLHATLEATADGIMVRNLAGKLIISNKRFSEMWHIPDQIMSTHDDNLMRAKVLDQLKEPREFLALTESQYLTVDKESKNVIDFKDGRVFERFAAPQVVDGRIVGRVICYRDITEQKNLEHQLRHAQKMEALGTLAGGVAHDFNNILTVIMGFCNLTAVQMEAGGPLRNNLDQIMTASERALTLTNSLLAYSRKQVMNPRPLELNAHIQRTEKFLARVIGEDIELVARPCEEKIVVMADGGHLDQVLMNLAANARDAMSRKGCLIIGTQKLDIDQEFVRLHGYGKPGTFALITVSDTGAGMDQKTREKIFEPFFTTKQVGQGTGLGLSIVYGIVKQHEGYINVYSEPGKGTTVNIYLPAIDRAVEALDAIQQAAAGGTETILLAEDDAGVRALVEIVLTGAGYRVIEARDGQDAIEKFQEHREAIDLLVLDVVMPKKNGKETFTEISALSPGTKAIFISGYTADIVGRNGLIDQGLHLVSKPLLPNQLLAKIREVLATGLKIGT